MSKNIKQKISIVMTTYNGSKYILQQLDSIRMQTRAADEVVICDDGSTDGTFELVQSYISEYGLYGKWYVYENELNLGWRRNFYEATKKATGDIIFFSDHDDVWCEDKLEKMAYVMACTGAGCVYGGATEIDAEGNELLSRTGRVEYSGKCKRMQFTTSFNTIKTLGCRMCISRDVANLYLKLDCADFGHDSQCGILALLFSKLYVLDRPVIKYRVHQGNNSGIAGNGVEGFATLDFRIYDTRENAQMLRAIIRSEECKDRLSSGRLKLVEKALRMQENRLLYLCESQLTESNCKNGGASEFSDLNSTDDKLNKQSIDRQAESKNNYKYVSWLSLWKYAKYYSGIGMLVGDFAYKHKLNHLFGKVLHALKKLKHE